MTSLMLPCFFNSKTYSDHQKEILITIFFHIQILRPDQSGRKRPFNAFTGVCVSPCAR